MSLKSIELQIAIPKTVDAGRIAEQKQQQSQLNQDLANALTERQAVKNRESVVQSEKYAKADPDKKGNHHQEEQNENQLENKKEKKTVHPYKGAFVDFTR